MLRSDRMAVELQEKERQNRRHQAKLIDEFRRKFQNPEQSRDWDLADPKHILKSSPLRKPGQNNVPVSSLLKFNGEETPKQKVGRDL